MARQLPKEEQEEFYSTCMREVYFFPPLEDLFERLENLADQISNRGYKVRTISTHYPIDSEKEYLVSYIRIETPDRFPSGMIEVQRIPYNDINEKSVFQGIITVNAYPREFPIFKDIIENNLNVTKLRQKKVVEGERRV